MELELEAVLEDAIAAARLAQGIHRYYQAKGFVAESKTTASDLVTEADREAERAVREYLTKRYPEFSFLGEEEGESGAGIYRWIVDPLDGTVNYAHRFPFYAVSVALARGDEVLVGVVLDSARDELFTAKKGGGAFLNGAPIRVSETSELKKSLLATGFPYDTERIPEAVEYFRRVITLGIPVRRPGAAALDRLRRRRADRRLLGDEAKPLGRRRRRAFNPGGGRPGERPRGSGLQAN